MEYQTSIIHSVDAFRERFNQVVADRKGGYVLALLTDRIELQRADEERLDRNEMYCKALEIRVFDEDGEDKWFRSSIGQEFRFRSRGGEQSAASDNKAVCEQWWDEEQYLDIDDQRKDRRDGRVRATGGGEYPLPLDCTKDAKIRIRNYLEYDEDTGELYISDWRILGFIEGEAK